jgi:hypothetical protein
MEIGDFFLTLATRSPYTLQERVSQLEKIKGDRSPAGNFQFPAGWSQEDKKWRRNIGFSKSRK